MGRMCGGSRQQPRKKEADAPASGYDIGCLDQIQVASVKIAVPRSGLQMDFRRQMG